MITNMIRTIRIANTYSPVTIFWEITLALLILFGGKTNFIFTFGAMSIYQLSLPNAQIDYLIPITDEERKKQSIINVFIIAVESIFLFIIGTIINPIIRADGSPKYAMFSMIIGAITNIVLDPVFLFGFNMGMQGAALATFLGQIVTFVLSVIYLFRAKTFKLKLSDFIPNAISLFISKWVLFFTLYRKITF